MTNIICGKSYLQFCIMLDCTHDFVRLVEHIPSHNAKDFDIASVSAEARNEIVNVKVILN